MCGYKRKRIPINNNSYTDLNLETLDNRLKQLALFDQATRYAKQKDPLRRELERFFASLPSSPTVMTATPPDICRFLVYKDKSGKTQVHKNGCIYLGKKGSFKCGCPLRLSYNTVDSYVYIGKLTAIFHAQHEMMNLRIFSICVKIRKYVAFSLRKSYSFRKDA